MGLVKHLLFWPVTVPAAVVEFSVRQIEGVARRELTDDERVKEDLMALQMELELGEIDDEEYALREAELMRRLREARAWRERLGMEGAWKPLSYASPAAPGDEDPRAPDRPERTGQNPRPPHAPEPPDEDPWPPISSDTSPDDS